MSFSYSKVDTFHQCPYKYKLRYIDKLEPIPDTSPENALFEGTAVHEGIEKRSIDAAMESYKSHYTELTEANEVEMLKIKTILKTAIEQIPEGEYEYKLLDESGFVGYIDCLVKNDDGTYDILDFKYSNNFSGYTKSAQIHVYRYFFEKLTGNKVRDIYYVFIPKYKNKLTEGMTPEDVTKLKEDIIQDLSSKDIIFQKIDYDKQQIGWFFGRKTLMEKAKVFEKKYTTMCNWCDYKEYCSTNGKDTSKLVIKEPVETIIEKPIVEQVSLF